MRLYRNVRKLRVPVSRFLAVPLGLLFLLSRSAWDGTHPITVLLFSIGLILVGVGSLGRLWCTLYIAGRKRKSLVTVGPYSVSRNPLYFFSLIGAIGIGFGTETLLWPLSVLLLFSIYYPFVISAEEARLLALHGEAFKNYCEKTPRFFPNLSLLKEPEIYQVSPIVFKKELFSALCFIWLLGLFEVIEAVHEMHLLPILLHIY